MNNRMPEYRSTAFICPHCGVYAKQTFYTSRALRLLGPTNIETPNPGVGISICLHCQKEMIWRECTDELRQFSHAEVLYLV